MVRQDAKQGKKDLSGQLKDLLEQRRMLRNRIATDADRAAYEKLNSQILDLKRKLKIVAEILADDQRTPR